jgi:CxxC motif-containing protein (DUF1111 family)
MGLRIANDPSLMAAQYGPVTTASGMVLNGLTDTIEKPPAEEGDLGSIEQRTALVDFLEFYLFSYFKPGTGELTPQAQHGGNLLKQIGCTSCHVQNLQIERDRRVADVETAFDAGRGHINRLFATATLLLANPSSIGQAQVTKRPAMQPFLVKNIFTDFKRHDLGQNFHERNFNGTMTTEFMTLPLWGVGNTPPYGHDGRSINLREVILRHGGEAQAQRNALARLPAWKQDWVIRFIESLVIFPPDDTASTLDPGNPSAPGFPQRGHGSIRLSELFNDPSALE